MGNTTNGTTHKGDIETDNTVTVRSVADLPDPIGSTITLGGVYIFKAVVTLDTGIDIALSANTRFIGTGTNVTQIVGSTTGTLIDFSGFGLFCDSVTFIQNGSGDLIDCDMGTFDAFLIQSCTFVGGAINLLAGFAAVFKGASFAAGARLIQRTGGGVSIIDIDFATQFADSGVTTDGLFVIESASTSVRVVIKNSAFTFQANNSTGIVIEGGAVISQWVMDALAITSLVGTNDVLIEVENPNDVQLGTFENISFTGLFGGSNSAFQCDPVVSSSVGTNDPTVRGICQDGDGNMIVSDSSNNTIVRYTGFTSVELDSITSVNIEVRALAWLKGDLYSCDQNTQLIYHHLGFTASLATPASIASPGGDVSGIAFIGSDLVSTDKTLNELYVHDGFSATLKETIDLSSDVTTLVGVAYDGVNLIVGDESNGNVLVLKGVSDEVQYTFAGGATLLADIWVTLDRPNNMIGFAIGDNSTTEMRLYDHPVVFDHSSPSWDVMDIVGVVESSVKSGALLQATDTAEASLIDFDMTTGNTWVKIDDSGADINWAQFGESEKFVLTDEQGGVLLCIDARQRSRTIDAYMTFKIANAGTDPAFEIAIFINDILQSDSINRLLFENANEIKNVVTVSISRDMVITDIVDLRIRRPTGGAADDPQISVAAMSIS